MKISNKKNNTHRPAKNMFLRAYDYRMVFSFTLLLMSPGGSFAAEGKNDFEWSVDKTELPQTTAERTYGTDAKGLDPDKLEPSDSPMTTPPVVETTKEERLRWRGIVTYNPPTSDTLSGDDGLRQYLAAHDIGYVGQWLVQGGYNFADHAHTGPDGRQGYFGQKLTYLTGPQINFIFDLSRYGLDAQIVAGATVTKTNWDSAGPDQAGLAVLTYYQTLLDKRVEVKAGFMANNYEFYGPFVGGNIASSIFGSSGGIPQQAGLSSIAFPRPGANVKLNFGEFFYDKFGVQRSSSPDGYVQQHADDSFGMKWDIPNAGTLYINELGYMRPAGPKQSQLWLRAGYIRNDSEFQNFRDGGRSNENEAGYVLGDGQLTQLDPAMPHRGLYGGFSAYRADPRYGAISSTYELRLYGMGLSAKRPQDVVSFIVSRNEFSHDLINRQQDAGLRTHDNSTNYTLAYNAKVTRGVVAGIGLTYSARPNPIIYDDDTGRSLTLLSNLIFFF